MNGEVDDVDNDAVATSTTTTTTVKTTTRSEKLVTKLLERSAYRITLGAHKSKG